MGVSYGLPGQVWVWSAIVWPGVGLLSWGKGVGVGEEADGLGDWGDGMGELGECDWGTEGWWVRMGWLGGVVLAWG